MPVSPEGPLSLMYARAAELLAASARFRTVVGAANEAAALAFIHYPEANWDATPKPTRPMAIISRVPGDQFTLQNDGSRSGTLTLAFEFGISADWLDEANSDSKQVKYLAEAGLTYENNVGKILTEMLEKSNAVKPGGGNYVRAVDVTMDFEPCLSRFEESGELYYASAWRMRFN